MPASNDLPPIVLTFAASDPTGGAGLQADLLTLAAMGCHPLSVVTGLTVQDTAGVEDMMAVDPEWVADQARTLLEDMPVAAFKIGVVGSVENAAAIAEVISDYPDIPVVFDPILASGAGDEFANENLMGAMVEMLLPLTTVLTPNSTEARRLAQDESNDDDDPGLEECARRLVSWGAEYVLITGTHEHTPQVLNTLYHEEGRVRQDKWDRLPGSYHGSGCTLASAIAACLAMGLDVDDAVREAQEFTYLSLQAGFRPGMGQHIPDRFFWAHEESSDDDSSEDADGSARGPDTVDPDLDPNETGNTTFAAPSSGQA